MLPLFGDRRPIPIATTCNPFPPSGGKWQVSLDGGSYPRWRGDGRELYFIGRDLKLVAGEVKSGPRFEAGAARALFQLDGAGIPRKTRSS